MGEDMGRDYAHGRGHGHEQGHWHELGNALAPAMNITSYQY